MSMPDVIYPTGSALSESGTWYARAYATYSREPYYSRAARDEYARRVALRSNALWLETPGSTFEECIDAALRELGGDAS